MGPEEIYQVWAPADSVWSPWVAPVVFSQLRYAEPNVITDESPSELPWITGADPIRTALILDLPGGKAVWTAIALARRGYRPVFLINSALGPAGFDDLGLPCPSLPASAVDMRPLVVALCGATPLLQGIEMKQDAPPAFLLDSLRTKGSVAIREELFDNRWVVFPQDFPSAQFLLGRGIASVVLVQEGSLAPQEDLAHVLLRWQESGVEIFAIDLNAGSVAVQIKVPRPSRFRALWYRTRTILGLHRSWVGGFGAFPGEGGMG